jgi:hypothetical protein
MSLAFALVYGFKKLTGAVERKPASAAGRRPVSGTDECFRGLYFRNSVYHRFDLLSGGKPCYDAVTQFVNATFDTDLDMSAIIRSCNRCKRRVYVATKFMESVDDRDIKARK